MKPRRMVRVAGVSPPVDLRGFNSTIDTLERAVKERVFFVRKDNQFVPPPQPIKGRITSVLARTRSLFVPLLPRTAPLTRLGFVETFRGRKRRMYEHAYSELLRHSFVPKDAELKVFVKYEKTDYTRKTDPVPRVICPRSTRYNIELGRFLRPIEERIFHSLAELFGHPTVFKGMNSSTSGKLMREKWNLFRDPCAVGLDASRWDQHVSKEALQWEHSIYLECFPRPYLRQLRRLLAMQVVNRCKGYTEDGKLKYKRTGGRMSGDMNTSLGNCILMCLLIHAYADGCGVRISLANNGDDCVLFMERRDLARFSAGLDEWFLAVGFTMEVEKPCFIFEQLEFCQTHPVYVGPEADSYIMVRHPKWGIAKDTCCIHPWESGSMFCGWLHSVGTGGMACTGRVPIFQDFYAAYLRTGKYHKSVDDGQSWGVRQLSKGMARTYGAILPETRASFYWAFGVTPDEQLVLEDFYRSVDIGSSIVPMEFQLPMPL